MICGARRDSEAKKGVEFSDGEVHKVAIARALYKEATFIILDELTLPSTRLPKPRSTEGSIRLPYSMKVQSFSTEYMLNSEQIKVEVS